MPLTGSLRWQLASRLSTLEERRGKQLADSQGWSNQECRESANGVETEFKETSKEKSSVVRPEVIFLSNVVHDLLNCQLDLRRELIPCIEVGPLNAVHN